MSVINTALKSAAIVALDELLAKLPVDGETYVGPFAAILSSTRQNFPLYLATDRTLITSAFESLRANSELYSAVMSSTTCFTLELDDLSEAIRFFSSRVAPYSGRSNIVDTATISRMAETDYIVQTLEDNNWLFFITYLSFNERLLLEALIRNGYKQGKNK